MHLARGARRAAPAAAPAILRPSDYSPLQAERAISPPPTSRCPGRLARYPLSSLFVAVSAAALTAAAAASALRACSSATCRALAAARPTRFAAGRGSTRTARTRTSPPGGRRRSSSRRRSAARRHRGPTARRACRRRSPRRGRGGKLTPTSASRGAMCFATISARTASSGCAVLTHLRRTVSIVTLELRTPRLTKSRAGFHPTQAPSSSCRFLPPFGAMAAGADGAN